MKFIFILLLLVIFPFNSYSAEDDWKNIPFYSEGKEYKISDFQGKIKLIMFWATWCPHCKNQMPAFSLLKNTYKNHKNLEIIAISTDRESEEEVKYYLYSRNLNNITSYMDYKSNLFKSMGFYAIPAMVLISADNKILGIYSGLQDFDIEYLDKVVADKE
jgi:thiol-disulfide isomerase/thioredoxin